MKTRITFSLVFLLLRINMFFAQDVTPTFKQDEMLWLGYYSTVNLNSKWSIVSDIQVRTKNWYKDGSQVLVRTGISYKINERISVTAGIAHFRYFITNTITRGEWRPWQEVALQNKIGKCKLTHRFRFEQRLNQQTRNDEPINDYQFNYRLRYKIELRIPLNKANETGKNLSLIVGNELMLNEGTIIKNNYFDQDRIYVGLNYELNKKLNFQLQYMHIWQQLSNGVTMNNIEVIRFNIYQIINL